MIFNPIVPKMEPAPVSWLTFSSSSSFTLRGTFDGTKYWDGTLEYSTNTKDWSVWDGKTELSSVDNKLYLRGTGNTKIAGEVNSRWIFARSTTDSYISCDGNIENLLDYQIVLNGEHPTMADYCYMYMFKDSALITAPELPATTLANYCYSSMFYGCLSLTTIPKLPATTLATGCYYQTFQGCSKVKLSETKTGTYTQKYRIPTSGTGTYATNALDSMFYGTGGTFRGTPTINTTYYLDESNSIVPPPPVFEPETWVISLVGKVGDVSLPTTYIKFKSNYSDTIYENIRVYINASANNGNVTYGGKTVCTLIRASSLHGWNDTWNDILYRTITFTEESPSGQLLTWLQANAVKQ